MKNSQQRSAQGLAAWLSGGVGTFQSQPERSEVLRQQISMVHSFMPLGLLINLVVSVTLGLFLMTPGMRQIEGLWILCSTLLCLFRYMDCLARRGQILDPAQLLRARGYLRLGATLQGLLWALAGTLMLPLLPLQQLFLMAVVSGMTAGGIIVLAPVWSAYALFAIPSIVPLCLKLLASDLVSQKLVGGLGLCYCSAMLFMAARTNWWIRESLITAQENATLTSHLQAANELLTDYHAQLEATVMQQTLELQQANEQLQKRNQAKARASTVLWHRLSVTRRAFPPRPACPPY